MLLSTRGLEEGVLEARELYSLPVLVCGLVAILFAGWLAKDVLARDTGTPAMQAGRRALAGEPSRRYSARTTTGGVTYARERGPGIQGQQCHPHDQS